MSNISDKFKNNSSYYSQKGSLVEAMELDEDVDIETPRGRYLGYKGEFLVKMPCGEYYVLCKSNLNALFSKVDTHNLIIMEQ